MIVSWVACLAGIRRPSLSYLPWHCLGRS